MDISKLGTSLTMAAMASFVVMSAVKADSVTQTVTTTTVDNPVLDSPGTVVTATPAPGGVIYLRSASPSLLVTTIEGRRKDLDQQIENSYREGKISADQADAMKIELRRIAAETGSNTISYSGAVMLAQDLDLIGNQYRTVVTAAPVYVPIIAGSHFTISNGQVLQLDDLSVRRADLEGRITKDLLQGRMTPSRANLLRSELNHIGNEAAFYRADGNLNDKEARHLYTDFDRVASQIERSAGKDN